MQPRDSQPRMKIFYLQPEEIFEKYADAEAELYYAEEAKRREEAQSQYNAKKDNYRQNDGGNRRN